MNGTQQLQQTPVGSQWEHLGIRQHHGIDIPLFSLHSRESCGIGEYPDLLPLIPWCKALGIDIIQLLPINDTGNDSGPYSALSAFALNPIHLGLTRLPYLKEYPALEEMLPAMQQLNNTQRIDYLKVRTAKNHFLLEYYRNVVQRIISTSGYQQFVSANNDWLLEYALFKALKIERHWQSWEQWEEALRNPTVEKIQELIKQHESEIGFHIFLQYLCFQQMQEVKESAERHGLFIKGDIPILINRESADVWGQRRFFLLQFSAGAPPDQYSADGQNWGFPIYNWAELEKEDYTWWKRRLKVASLFYHIYRIDHIVGFFRIWSIPAGRSGKEGHYIPEDPATWIEHGTKIMRMMVECCPMLPIGEDLGSVPPEVRQRLLELGISGTKVMRWERAWQQENKPFIKYENYPLASMTTVSTHDSDTLQLWWENSPQEAKEFAAFKGWEYTYDLSRARHQEILRDSHHTNSLFHINLLQEYLALISGMTWPNPDDERINLPGVISERNWTYRFKPSLEEIVSSPELSQVMRDILS